MGSVEGRPPPSARVPGAAGLLAHLVAHPLRGGTSRRRFPARLLFACRSPVVWAKLRLDGISGRRTPLFSDRWSLLEAAARRAPSSGLLLEFGVYQGASIGFLARLVPRQWYGFDSFEGLPTGWAPGFGRGSLALGGIVPTVPDNVRLVPGWFAETLPGFLRSVGEAPVSFLHVDSDLYQSADTVLSHLGSRILNGTVIVFDEYTGLMPDDEARAFRHWRRATGARFEVIGCAPDGSVAVRILERRH